MQRRANPPKTFFVEMTAGDATVRASGAEFDFAEASLRRFAPAKARIGSGPSPQLATTTLPVVSQGNRERHRIPNRRQARGSHKWRELPRHSQLSSSLGSLSVRRVLTGPGPSAIFVFKRRHRQRVTECSDGCTRAACCLRGKPVAPHTTGSRHGLAFVPLTRDLRPALDQRWDADIRYVRLGKAFIYLAVACSMPSRASHRLSARRPAGSCARDSVAGRGDPVLIALFIICEHSTA
jgi:hypothetical protein